MPTMRPLRILLVANFGRRRQQTVFYNVECKLHAGLVRNGHHVLTFSDRDVSQESSPLRISSRLGGRWRMCRQLIETATHYHPDLIILGHVDLLDQRTIHALQKLPGVVRLAQFNVDCPDTGGGARGFAGRLPWVDISFITTGDISNCPWAGEARGPIHFLPNPVDASIETGRVHDTAREGLAYDGQFLGNDVGNRHEQLTELRSRLPEEYRLNCGGGLFGTPMIRSVEFLQAIRRAAATPNLSQNDGIPARFLYTSDRIAQLLGNGVLAITARGASLRTLYDDGIVEYGSREELAETMVCLWTDDRERRRIAERGWRIAHERTACDRVTRYMVETCLGERPSEDYGWPVDPLN